MTGPAGDLPGFYWDEEKCRYFKIEKGHKLPESMMPYSAENIKKAERLAKVGESPFLRFSQHYQSILPTACPKGQFGMSDCCDAVEIP
jgi:hypothetical protein